MHNYLKMLPAFRGLEDVLLNSCWIAIKRSKHKFSLLVKLFIGSAKLPAEDQVLLNVLARTASERSCSVAFKKPQND